MAADVAGRSARHGYPATDAARRAGPQPDEPQAGRRRNARGEGSRLSDEIVSAALALIERTDSDEAVTLRAVAREIGIAAPSIYAHFPDRDAILSAVVVRIFDELADAINASTESVGEDPVDRLVAGCSGYVRFGLTHPARYNALFSQHRIGVLAGADDSGKPVTIGADGRPDLKFGTDAFAILLDGIVACVRAGESVSTDPLADATAVWVGLHGAVSLRIAMPGFPWPDPADLVRQLVLALARVTRPAGATTPA
jgi:AcrR family transcriptional regulator